MRPRLTLAFRRRELAMLAVAAAALALAAGGAAKTRLASSLRESGGSIAAQDAVLGDNGLGHFVYGDQPAGSPAQAVYYEQLPGSRRLNEQALVPPIAAPPDQNEDVAGPRLLRSGATYLLLTHRYPGPVPMPASAGGGVTANSTWLYHGLPIASNGPSGSHGGVHWSAPELVGTGELSGGAAVSSTGLIAIISSNQTGGTYLQVLRPGSFTDAIANLGDGTAYSGTGTVAFVNGTTPIMASTNALGHVYTRIWTGTGDYADPNSWSPPADIGTFSGAPLLVAGRRGVVLLTGELYGNVGWIVLRRWQGDGWSAPIYLAKPKEPFDFGPRGWTLVADPTGLLHLVVDQEASVVLGPSTSAPKPDLLWTISSPDGVHWSQAHLIARSTLSSRWIDATFDSHDRAFVTWNGGSVWWNFSAATHRLAHLGITVSGCRVCKPPTSTP